LQQKKSLVASGNNISKPIIRTNKFTRYYRISRIILHTIVGFIIAGIMLPFTSKPLKLKLISWWCKHLLGVFNIGVIYTGNVPQNPQSLQNCLVVANHISWADIHALTSIIPVRFIAKSEIRNWPILGYLANKANALFIDRAKRHDAAKTVNSTKLSLIAGDNICLFPEGTTTDGTELKVFKGSLIQAAIEAKSTILPVVIRYALPDGSPNIEAAYAGETTLPESMQLMLSQKNPIVSLLFLSPISLESVVNRHFGRRSLTLHLEGLIRQELGFIR